MLEMRVNSNTPKMSHRSLNVHERNRPSGTPGHSHVCSTNLCVSTSQDKPLILVSSLLVPHVSLAAPVVKAPCSLTWGNVLLDCLSLLSIWLVLPEPFPLTRFPASPAGRPPPLGGCQATPVWPSEHVLPMA